jgi:acyl CoA:acetate/3-ketoacid CoA transferase beta subunit
MYVAALARELTSDDTVHVGASQSDVWLACALAQALWAPELRVVAAGTYLLSSGQTRHQLSARTYDPRLITVREGTFQQSRVFHDLRRDRVVFAGGIQMDRRGNANLIGIYDGDRLTFRGPGSGGLPTLTSHAKRFYLTTTTHNARTLVEQVSRVSVLGDPQRRADSGLHRDSMAGLITPLARFNQGTDGLQVVEIAPGLSVEDLARQTGFKLELGESVKVRKKLSKLEASTLHLLQEGQMPSS